MTGCLQEAVFETLFSQRSPAHTTSAKSSTGCESCLGLRLRRAETRTFVAKSGVFAAKIDDKRG
jgi:hypothetical protein